MQDIRTKITLSGGEPQHIIQNITMLKEKFKNVSAEIVAKERGRSFLYLFGFLGKNENAIISNFFRLLSNSRTILNSRRIYKYLEIDTEKAKTLAGYKEELNKNIDGASAILSKMAKIEKEIENNIKAKGVVKKEINEETPR